VRVSAQVSSSFLDFAATESTYVNDATGFDLARIGDGACAERLHPALPGVIFE
jgi:hypothetical protein